MSFLTDYRSVPKSRHVGVIGFGNIGAGVIDLLVNRKVRGVALTKIAVRDVEKERAIGVPPTYITRDINQILNDPEIDTVVELMGGIEPAASIIIEALRKGKDVVTANKALIASRGREIFSEAARLGRSVGFRGTFVGCYPLLHEFSHASPARKIRSLHAVLSGTCNYILTRMSREGKSFDDALKEAQEKGYAESNPSEDIDGVDTANKTRILLALITDSFETRRFDVEGITNITSDDISYARELGYSIKLLGIIEQKDDVFYVGVHPALVPSRSLLGTLDGEFNGLELVDEHKIVAGYSAQGAGTYPTAVAVIKDLVDIAEGRKPPMPLTTDAIAWGSLNDLTRRYYIRLGLVDRVGTLAKITNVFSSYNISIAAVFQKETSREDYVPVVLTTHLAKESDVNAAVRELDNTDVVRTKTNVIRIIESENQT